MTTFDVHEDDDLPLVGNLPALTPPVARALLAVLRSIPADVAEGPEEVLHPTHGSGGGTSGSRNRGAA